MEDVNSRIRSSRFSIQSVFYFLDRLSKMSHSHLSTRQRTEKAYVLTYTVKTLHFFSHKILSLFIKKLSVSSVCMMEILMYSELCFNSRLFVRRIIMRYNLHLCSNHLQRVLHTIGDNLITYSTHIQYLNNYNSQ